MALHAPALDVLAGRALPLQVETAATIPDWLFPASTAMALLGLALSFWHASTREEYSFILAAIGWGYILEQASIAGYETYSYNIEGFVLTLFDVPLDVAFTWGGILYAGWQTARYLGLSRRRTPVFVGLFALHIDLAIDAIAVRVPFWTWGVDGIWYGIPLHNFWGWFTVAFLFVGWFLLLERWIDRPELRAILTLPTALVSFVVGITIWGTAAAITELAEIAMLSLIVAAAIVVVLTADVDPEPVPWRLAVIPFIIHIYFFAIGAWLGVFGEFPVLLGMAVAMFLASLVLHLVPHWYERRSRTDVASG